MKKCKTLNRQELIGLMEKFTMVYDVVRIVEPGSTSVVWFNGEQLVKAQKESCFSVWEKNERCDNCISLQACLEKKRISKFEFCNDETYYVISMPFIIKEDDMNEHLIALELVNKVSDDTLISAHGSGAVSSEVKKISNQMYMDSLTGVYNRRYYNENFHISEMLDSLPHKLGYLVIDINRFKFINDTFGHDCGDDMLVAVASTLRQNVRETDRVIRIGGDEFLVVLRDCEKSLVKKKIVDLKKAVNMINLDWLKEQIPSISVGMSYTNSFTGSEAQLKEMFKEADKNMYLDKRIVDKHKKKLLLVDDIEINRDVLRNYFENEFDVYEAENGYIALEILNEEPIDIVITDIYMPEMDGLSLTRRIRTMPGIKNIVIFVVTERGATHELEALKAGADDFINKPFSAELLEHRIKGVLAQNTVANRISQYQLSFNQNQIAFATVRVVKGQVIYEYVNDALAGLMGSVPEEFVSGRRGLPFKEIEGFLSEVNETGERNRMTVYDECADNYYDIIAYAHDDNFCSFILLRNDSIKLSKQLEKQYLVEFDDLINVNPNTFGALFVNLSSGLCEKGLGRSAYMKNFHFPMRYDEIIEQLVPFVAVEQDKKKFIDFCSGKRLVEAYEMGETKFSIAMPFKLLNGETHWIGIYAKLKHNEYTGDLEEILYSVDIHERKISQLVIDTVSKRNFDTLFCIDVGANMAQIYMGNSEIYWSQPYPCAKIDDEVAEYLQKYYCEEDKEEFIKENSISNIAEMMKNRDVYTVNYYLTDDKGEKHLKKGTYYWLDSTRTLLCFTREDITEVVRKEKDANDRLQEVNKQLVKATNAKMDFLSKMSHDIRTPMNTIIGLTALAMDDIENPEKMKKYINNINSSSKFLLGLVNDILDMDKIGRGKMKFNMAPYGYPEFVSTLKMMFEPICKNKNIKLHFEELKSSYIVMTDKIRLNQIFFNILSNAIKYTQEGGKVSYYTANLEIGENTIARDYIVEDNGIGMSEEFQRTMFQEFVQEGKLSEVSAQGSGLGLSITKNLIELMGGTIKIESAPGKGTKVIIHMSFQLADDQMSYVPMELDEVEDRTDSLRGITVLLVEDHPLNQQIGKKLLEKKGIIVHTADNGREAVEKFMESGPEYFKAILMDIRMPELDGISATEKIRNSDHENAKSIPIIAMSANAYNEDIERSIEAGMNAHVSKPIEPERLYETLVRFTSTQNKKVKEFTIS